MKANSDAWRLDEVDFPTKGSAAEKWRFLLRYAVLAPSLLNTQPWLFEICGNRLDMFCDPARALPELDCNHRGLTISCGAALMNLRLAIHYFGHSALFQILPVPTDEHFVARIYLGEPPRTCLPGQGLFHTTRQSQERLEPSDTLAPDEVLRRMLLYDFRETELDQCGWQNFEPSQSDEALFHAMLRRRTNRSSWLSRQPSNEELEGCFNGAVCTGAWFHVISDSSARTKIVELITQAEREQAEDAATCRAIASWVRPWGRRAEDGLPAHILGFTGSLKILNSRFPKLSRILKGRLSFREDLSQFAASTPILAVVGTEEDTPAAWIEAGQALELVLLNATVAGLSASMFNQLLEVEHLRAQFHDLITRTGFPQVVLGLGFAETGAHTPRRRVEEVLL